MRSIIVFDLLIKVREYPRLKAVELSGNEEFDKDDIEKEIIVYRGMRVSPVKMSKISQTIKNMYLEEGYLLAEINIDTVAVETGMVNMNIFINEGKEVQVEKIRFHGNEIFDDDDLKDAMEDIGEDTWLTSGDFDQNSDNSVKLRVSCSSSV